MARWPWAPEPRRYAYNAAGDLRALDWPACARQRPRRGDPGGREASTGAIDDARDDASRALT